MNTKILSLRASSVLYALAIGLLASAFVVYGAFVAFAQEVQEETVVTETTETVVDETVPTEEEPSEETSTDEGAFNFSSDETSVTEEVVDETPADEPAPEEPTVEELASEKPVVEESVTEESIVEESFGFTSDEPAAEETPTEEPASEETIAEATASSDGGSSDLAPELSTDKDDYRPGDTATIFGRFFTPLRTFVLKVFGSDANEQNYTETVEEVDTDKEGSFSFAYLLDSLYRPFYEVEVSDESGDVVASTWFRDSAIGTYDQCANDDGDGYTTGDLGCRWINGNIQSNNSTYYEGDSTVQRFWLEGLVPGDIHNVTFTYGTTKQGKHAYDFLTRWDQSENWVSEADLCQDIDDCEGSASITASIPGDSNVPDFIETAYGPREFELRGVASSTVISGPTLVTGAYGGGDSETSVTLAFEVDDESGDMCKEVKVGNSTETVCGVAIFFGAHVAEGELWIDTDSGGDGFVGATGIPGSPYHVALAAIDGDSVGQRDNQMQSGAILAPENGTIVINKVTVGGDAEFDYIGDLGSFALDTSIDGNFASTTFLDLPAGVYEVTESAEKTGWDFTDLTCVDPDDETTTLDTTATIDLDPEETIVCTYTNTERGSITIEKQTLPDGDGQSFTFTGDVSGSLSDGQDATESVAPGQYDSTETVPSGWVLTDITCDDGDSSGNTGTGVATFNVDPGEDVTCVFTNTKDGRIEIEKQTAPGSEAGDFDFTGDINTTLQDDGVAGLDVAPGQYSVTESDPSPYFALTDITCDDANSSGDTGTGEATFNVEPGETVRCTFTNTLQTGNIIVEKQTDPDGDPELFTFNPSWGSSFDLADDGTEDSGPLNPGNYSVSEAAEAGWDLISATCDNGDDPSSIDLDPNETVTCTFTNQKDANIIIEKQTLPDGSSEVFDFDHSWGDGDADLSDGQTDDSGDLDPGTYSVSENVPSGWALTDVTCSDGSDPASIDLEAGETVTCVFTNTQDGSITIEKVVEGADADFDFTGDVSGTLGNGDTATQAAAPGQYTSTEITDSAYDLTDITCDDGDSSGNTGTGIATFNVDPGENVTCTFTNSEIPTLTLVKILPNDDGGDATQDQFQAYIDGSPVDWDTAYPLTPDDYTASEDTLSGYSASGWGDDCAADGSVTLAYGDHKTCEITNDDQPGQLIVNKVTDPASDTTTEFTITATPDGSGFIESPAAEQTITGGSQVIYTVHAGTYDVTEAPLSGWVETGNTCDDVVVPLGGQGECTITNTQNGHIIVVKDVIGNPDPTDFTFQNDFGNGNPASFMLDEDNDGTLPSQRDFEVLPGTYSVSEDAMDHWQLESATCDNGDDPSDITVDPGETVTCTFVNEELITITLVKQTVGGDATFDFDMTGPGLPASDSLTTVNGSSSETYIDLDQDDAFTIAEVVPAGWVLTSATCTGGETPDNITPEPGEDVTCTFVNRKPAAQIDVTPLEAFNAVDDEHVITAEVQVHDGDGVWGPSPDGTEVTFTLENNNNGAAFVGGVDTCFTSGGSCSVSINTGNTGSVEIHAEASPEVLGLNIDVETDGVGQNSENAEKTYVNARIGIAQSETNEVDDPHTFTVTVEADNGDGTGFQPVEGVYPVVTFSPANPGTVTDNCVGTGTDVNGECTVEINSGVAGIFDANAAIAFEVEGVLFDIETDGTGENSDTAIKTYVDASIALTPQTGTNEVDDEHDITVHVTKDDGTGPVDAEGEIVQFSITSGSATFVGDDFCETDANGECTITIIDNTAGLNEIDAEVTVSVGGLDLDRATDADAGPDGSDEAEKTYVDARISIGDSATNNVGDAHVFTIHVEENDGTGWTDASGETVDTELLNNLAGATYVGDSFCVTDGSGECTVTINSVSPGTVDINAYSDVTVGGLSLYRETDGTGDNSDDATKTYEAAKIIVEKVTVGGDDSFEFDTDYGANFFLMNGENDNSGWIATGTYAVAEVNIPDGWDLTDATCDNGDDPDSITVEDGDEVTCTFTNTKRAKLTIIKNAEPNDLQDFDFNLTNNDDVDENFALDDDAGIFDGDDTLLDTEVFDGADGLVAGEYDVTETLPNDFWTHEGVTCTYDAGGDFAAVDIELGVTLDLEAGDEVTCVFLNTKPSPTRTQGFWQTHLEYTSGVFAGMGSSLVIGDPTAKTITTINELFGAFWSNIANKTTPKGKNGKRSEVDKARMQLLQQLVAAELNCAAFGCTSDVHDMLDDAHDAYSDGDKSDILFYVGEVDAFNNSGDTLVVGNTGKADPKTIKQTVDLQFWDDPASEL